MARSIVLKLLLSLLILGVATFWSYSWPLVIISIAAGLLGSWTKWSLLNAYLVAGSLGGILIIVLFGKGLSTPLIWPLFSLVVVLSLNQALIILLRHDKATLQVS